MFDQITSFLRQNVKSIKLSVEDLTKIIVNLKSKFSLVKDQHVVEPPEINNDPFHPNYWGFKDMSPEDVFDLVENIDFSASLVQSLQNKYLLD